MPRKTLESTRPRDQLQDIEQYPIRTMVETFIIFLTLALPAVSVLVCFVSLR